MTKSIVSLDDLRKQLTENLKNEQSRLPPSTNTRITVGQDKVFRFPDGVQTDGNWSAVILAYQYFNAFYKKRYVPGQITSPNCWAANMDATALAPDSSVSAPEAKSCDNCPRNEWGSSLTGGRGKACSNKVRLAVVPPNATNESEVWTIDLSPTAQGLFTKVLRELYAKDAPLQMVVMEFGFDPKVDFPKVTIRPIESISEDVAQALPVLIDKAQKAARVDLNYNE